MLSERPIESGGGRRPCHDRSHILPEEPPDRHIHETPDALAIVFRTKALVEDAIADALLLDNVIDDPAERRVTGAQLQLLVVLQWTGRVTPFQVGRVPADHEMVTSSLRQGAVMGIAKVLEAADGEATQGSV